MPLSGDPQQQLPRRRPPAQQLVRPSRLRQRELGGHRQGHRAVEHLRVRPFRERAQLVRRGRGEAEEGERRHGTPPRTQLGHPGPPGLGAGRVAEGHQAAVQREGLQALPEGLAADRVDALAAGGAQGVRRDRADAARRAVHEDRLAGAQAADLVEEGVRCGQDGGERRRRPQAEALGERDRGGGLGADGLRVAAAGEERGDLLAGGGVGGLGVDRLRREEFDVSFPGLLDLVLRD